MTRYSIQQLCTSPIYLFSYLPLLTPEMFPLFILSPLNLPVLQVYITIDPLFLIPVLFRCRASLSRRQQQYVSPGWMSKGAHIRTPPSSLEKKIMCLVRSLRGSCPERGHFYRSNMTPPPSFEHAYLDDSLYEPLLGFRDANFSVLCART